MLEDLHVRVSHRHRATGEYGARPLVPPAARARLRHRPLDSSGRSPLRLKTKEQEAMPTKKITIATLAALHARGEKAVFVTAYDYPTARA